jgi:hypothetical protein
MCGMEVTERPKGQAVGEREGGGEGERKKNLTKIEKFQSFVPVYHFRTLY